MYSIVPRKRRLKDMIEAKGKWLMFRQWFHGISGIIASFFTIYVTYTMRKNVDAMLSFLICGVCYSYASLLWAFIVKDKIVKFRRQIEGYRKLCGTR